ncbi:DUF6603 domain-containing protein [Egicoccus halophilus]|uniref:DUF6603 domain-containing protein n=1 Tax=Egicoccus halophilus TaxID=1670830 RepID=A0A8J3A802_9ACTN|nr:DUF6603 domain-containing protein [Egicoccus halophilus]GGI03570.1 hypothetical protein GCM10011354_04690 [Egicoccus halophilus]
MTTNLVVVALEQFTDLLQPIREITEADDPLLATRRFLRSAGWHLHGTIDVAPITSTAGTVLAAVEAAKDGLDPKDLVQFTRATVDVLGVVAKLGDLIDAFTAAGPGGDSATREALGEDVVHRLLVGWLRRRRVVRHLASPLGLITTVDVDERAFGGWLVRRAGTAERLRPAALLDLLDDPVATVRDILAPHGIDERALAATTNLFVARLFDPALRAVGGRWELHPDALADADRVLDLGRKGFIDLTFPVADGDGNASVGTTYEVLSGSDVSSRGTTGPGLELAPHGRYSHRFSRDGWEIDLAVMVLLAGVDAGTAAPAIVVDADGVHLDAHVTAEAAVGASFDLDVLVGGMGSRIELGTIELRFETGVSATGLDVELEVVARGARIVFSAADLGAAVAAVVDFENAIEFDLGLAWSIRDGLRLSGAASLVLEFTEGIDIGGVVALSGMRVALELGDGLSVAATADVRIALGPVAMVFEDVGLAAVIALGSGDGPPFALAPRLPTGIGVRIDAGVVRGGGFLSFDPERGEYAGILELGIPALSLSLKAVGIFTTDLPGGADGYALLLLVYAEFPAVQLGYGFTLNGVGGILGIQHGVSLDALTAGMRTGALDNVLFPDDPVARAPGLLNDLRAVFPIVPGALTFGPVLQLGWGTGIVTLSLGLVVQFDDVLGGGGAGPTLSRIVLIGQLEVRLPPIEGVPALVRLLVDIVGWFEVSDLELGIDARLRDSHVSGLPLTGSLTVRARFGDRPTFVMAVGGFHPAFTDLPPGLPPQDRIGFALVRGKLRAELAAYLAITSNTFQVGAQVSVRAEVMGFRVEAYLGFDALFVFEPRFHFTIDFRVGASISYKKWDFASVRFRGNLTGPGRWQLTGYATVTILGFDKDVDVNEAWGAAPATPLPNVAVLSRVVQALTSADAWQASLPAGPLVTLRPVEAGLGEVVVHPMGRLQARQTVVPLGIDVARVGASRPSDGPRYTIDLATVEVGGVPATDVRLVQEHFARAEYLDLSEDDKLAAPSFERFDAGIAIGLDGFVLPDRHVGFEPEHETKYLQASEVSELTLLRGDLLVTLSHWGAAAYTERARYLRLVGHDRLAIEVREPGHEVVDAVTLAPVTLPEHAVTGDRPMTFTEAMQWSEAVAGPVLAVQRAEVLA